jgi:two-component system sensor histidine kinase BaeS
VTAWSSESSTTARASPRRTSPAIFDRFVRVDGCRSRKAGGYGLGLSICKRIVEAHGGQITANNNPVRGACFTLTFPMPATNS